MVLKRASGYPGGPRAVTRRCARVSLVGAHLLPRSPTSQAHSRWGWRNFYLQLEAPALPLVPADSRSLTFYPRTGGSRISMVSLLLERLLRGLWCARPRPTSLWESDVRRSLCLSSRPVLLYGSPPPMSLSTLARRPKAEPPRVAG